jgi:hypothetical protein
MANKQNSVAPQQLSFLAEEAAGAEVKASPRREKPMRQQRPVVKRQPEAMQEKRPGVAVIIVRSQGQVRSHAMMEVSLVESAVQYYKEHHTSYDLEILSRQQYSQDYQELMLEWERAWGHLPGGAVKGGDA